MIIKNLKKIFYFISRHKKKFLFSLCCILAPLAIIKFIKTLLPNSSYINKPPFQFKFQFLNLFSKQQQISWQIYIDYLFKSFPALSICSFFLYFYYSIIRQKDSFIPEIPKVKFEDIYGNKQPKTILQQIINYQSQQLANLGIRKRKGIILFGPPGTGKTMLAKALANQSKSFFFYKTASQFIQIYAGSGPKKVRALFKLARQHRPSVIFIDEIDALSSRNQINMCSERNSTLNQLLTQMDGFIENQDLTVIAATNRINAIDQALLRPGRFDYKIKINLPNLEERIGILKLHIKKQMNASLSDNLIQELGKLTTNFSGAQLENIVNEGMYICIREKQTRLQDQHLKKAFQLTSKQKNYE